MSTCIQYDVPVNNTECRLISGQERIGELIVSTIEKALFGSFQVVNSSIDFGDVPTHMAHVYIRYQKVRATSKKNAGKLQKTVRHIVDAGGNRECHFDMVVDT